MSETMVSEDHALNNTKAEPTLALARAGTRRHDKRVADRTALDRCSTHRSIGWNGDPGVDPAVIRQLDLRAGSIGDGDPIALNNLHRTPDYVQHPS